MRHRDMRLCALRILLASSFVPAACLAEVPAFDAASVKLFGPDVPKATLFSGGPGTDDPGRLHLRVNMSLLLGAAFGLSADQVKGPAWLRDFSAMPFYDIVATMRADSSKKQVEAMLQNLLVERFHLVFHRETGSFPGYELIVDAGGPKMKEATAESDSGPARDPLTWRPGTVSQRIKDQESTMADLARQLGFLIGRSLGRSLDDGFFQPRVVNKTGLAGKYTFILEYDCPACVPLAPVVSGIPESRGFPNIFTAVQKELGLRLIRTSDVAMDVIAVDALDRTPTEN